MVVDPKASPSDLAAFIVTLPEGTDFSQDPTRVLQKTLLTGKPEERDPLKYAEIFGRAATSLNVSPWMRFACRAEELNGERRAKDADMQAIAVKLDALAEEAGNALPNTKARNMLLGGVLWSGAIVKRGRHQYKEEAATQRLSAAYYGLAGETAKQLVGMFAAQVGEVTAAFASNGDGEITRACLGLIAARDYAANALPIYPDWMQENASIHIAWALAMAHLGDVPGANAAFLDQHEADFFNGRHSRLAQWARVFQVWKIYRNGWHANVIVQDPVDLPSSSADNAALTVKLLVALSQRALGQEQAAKTRLAAIANHQGPDGGIPMAVAKRLL